MAKPIVGDGGRPMHEWYEVGDMLQEVTYNGTLERLDGRWKLNIQWVDLTNIGHRVVLPHEVVAGLFNAGNRVMDLAVSDRAKRAAETRKASTKAARHTVDSIGGMWNWVVHRVVINRPEVLQKVCKQSGGVPSL